jgi:hypothetical protein
MFILFTSLLFMTDLEKLLLLFVFLFFFFLCQQYVTMDNSSLIPYYNIQSELLLNIILQLAK